MINARTLTMCAPQWISGLAFSLNAAVFIGMTTVMLPPDMNMTPSLDRQAIMNICKHTGAESIITPPFLIEDFYTDEAAFDFLKSQKYVCWLGAGLDHKVGDELAQHTNLFPVIGSTERGAALSFESDDASMWKSYEFVPEMGHRFELVADEIYELYVDRTSESSLFQCGFYTFPHLDTINTEELYSPTVDKNDTKRWISRGRKDDLVKLSWLAKFHATHIEDAIARHPQVAAVVVGGEGRDVPYIIIEPRDWTMVGHPHMFVDEIYDTVIYRINEKDNDEIRIPREMVMLSDPDLPFKRTMKMTIMRKEVERMYENHINTLYLNSGTKKMNGGAVNGHKEGIKV
jgi:acyl-coenzyme A synthetase/AMP-(fatty) acid ligase